jgi:hypothetical protein
LRCLSHIKTIFSAFRAGLGTKFEGLRVKANPFGLGLTNGGGGVYGRYMLRPQAWLRSIGANMGNGKRQSRQNRQAQTGSQNLPTAFPSAAINNQHDFERGLKDYRIKIAKFPNPRISHPIKI